LAGPQPAEEPVAGGAPTAGGKENRRDFCGFAEGTPGSVPAAGEEKAPFHDAGNDRHPGSEADDGGTPEDAGAGLLERPSSGGSVGSGSGRGSEAGAPTAVSLQKRF